MTNKKPDINVIAKMAEVSTATVSHFINRTETIPLSDARRNRIMEAMRKTNYRPSHSSGNLRRNKELPAKAVFIFGSDVSCPCFRTCALPHINELLLTLNEKMLERLNLTLEVRAVKDEDNYAAWNETLSDAEAVVCYAKLDVRLLELTTRRNIPLILLSDYDGIMTRDIDPSALPPLDYIHWDVAWHFQRMLERLAEKGARSFLFVNNWNNKQNNPLGFGANAEIVETVFKDFLAKQGLSGEALNPPRPSDESCYYQRVCTQDILADRDLRNCDAILGLDDIIAQGIIDALFSKGLRPGRDIMVCGDGDYSEYRCSNPAISTACYDRELLSDKVCALLGRRLAENYPSGEHILVPSEIMERDSTGGWRR